MKIVAMFESWQNGGIQLSALILKSQVGQEGLDKFMQDSADSYAKLHVFGSETRAKAEYERLCKERDDR